MRPSAIIALLFLLGVSASAVAQSSTAGSRTKAKAAAARKAAAAKKTAEADSATAKAATAKAAADAKAAAAAARVATEAEAKEHARAEQDAAATLAANRKTPPKGSMFRAGDNVLGASVGVGGLGSASLSFGGRFEHAIKTMPEWNGGVLSAALDIDYYSYSNSYLGISYGLNFIPIGATINYNFPMNDQRWDPFVGVGVGYLVMNSNVDGDQYSGNSGVYVISRLGARYFFSPRAAFQVDAGVGAAVLHIGAVVKP